MTTPNNKNQWKYISGMRIVNETVWICGILLVSVPGTRPNSLVSKWQYFSGMLCSEPKYSLRGTGSNLLPHVSSEYWLISQYWIICSTCNWLKCTIRKPNEPWKFTTTHIMKVYINLYNPLHVITKWYQCSRLSLVEFFCVHIGLIGIFPNPKLSEPAIYVFELLKWKAGSPPDFKKSLGVGWRAWLCPGREAGARKTSNGNTMEQ